MTMTKITAASIEFVIATFASLHFLFPISNAFHLSCPPVFGSISSTYNRCATLHQSRVSPLFSENVPIGNEGDAFDASYRSLSSQQFYSHAIINKVFVAKIESLRDRYPSFEEEDHSGSGGSNNKIKFNKRRVKGSHFHSRVRPETDLVDSHVANLEYNHLVENDELILLDTVRSSGMKSVSRAFLTAGPRRILHFDPSQVNAAIVTCGGLCPGLNTVIRELVHALYYMYGARTVYGITGGFHGFYSEKQELQPILLTNHLVENIHHEGGTILKSARGGLDIEKTVQFLRDKNIQQLYLIGGDGTHRAAYKIHKACQENNLNVAIAGIPKSIENDIDYIDRSFGFLSAVEAAQASIRSAKTEAMCFAPNAVGLIELMGRSAGFLAAYAAQGSVDVDAVIIPEVPLVLEGPDGILPFIRKRVKEQHYAVVVVAEGAGEEVLGRVNETEVGGNRKHARIGEFMKKEITKHFQKHGDETSVKYIDPSYTVRSVPSNAADTLYCMQLAQNAVHGAMAGFTGFSVGLINNRLAYLPIPLLVARSPRCIDPNGRTWEQILAMTGQPNTAGHLNEVALPQSRGHEDGTEKPGVKSKPTTKILESLSF